MKLKQIPVFLFLFILFLPQVALSNEPAQIESFNPQGEVKGIRQVTARFTEEIVPLGDPRVTVEPFDIDCPASGSQRWADGKNWVFDFDKDLPAGIRCTFRLKDGIKTADGSELKGGASYSFTTGGPAVIERYPYYGSIDEEQAFILVLDAEADEISIASHAYFLVEGMEGTVGVNILSGKEKATVLNAKFGHNGRFPANPVTVLQAKQRFPVEKKVRLVWGKGIESRSGVATSQDQTFDFTTREPFRAEFNCERTNQGSSCVPLTNMSLRFTSAVEWKRAKQILLKGHGGKVYNAQGDEKELTDDSPVFAVYFKAPFPEKSEFSISIPEDIVDDAGRKLENQNKFPLKIFTGAYPPLAKFASTFGVVELNAGPALPVTVRNIEQNILTRMLKVGGKKDGFVGAALGIFNNLKGKILRVNAGAEKDIFRAFEWVKRVEQGSWNYMEDSRGTSLFTIDEMNRADTFNVPKPNGSKAFEVIGIPLEKPGLYVVEIESAMLGQALLDPPKPMYVPATALVTNLSVHFKKSDESSLIWVTALDTGKPVEEAKVSIMDCTGKVIWNGMTDWRGVATVGKLPSYMRCDSGYIRYGFLVTAQLADDFSFVHSDWNDGIEPWRFGLNHSYEYDRIIAHTVFDRSLLRAGEVLHMKHFLRQFGPKRFENLAENEMLEWANIIHTGSGQQYQIPIKWDKNGTGESTWQIPKEARMGEYTLEIPRFNNSGFRTSGSFRVEEYRVPLMKAVVKPLGEDFVSPKELPLDISLQYLSGGGATEQSVKLRAQLEIGRSVNFKDFEEFTIGNGAIKEGISSRRPSYDYVDEGYYEEDGGPERKPAQVTKLRTLELTLDKAGFAQTSIKDIPSIKETASLLTELEFRDPNGETQTVSSRVNLWPSRYLVGIKTDSWASSKENLRFYALVTDTSGRPLQDIEVKADIFEHLTYSHRKRVVGGFYAYEHAEEIKKVKTFCEGKTDKKGLIICEGPSPVEGDVIIQALAVDSESRESAANKEIWVIGDKSWWFKAGDSDRIDLLPEKKGYQPGEVARFQVRMPFKEATALVTVEREGVLDYFVIPVNSKKPVISVPIKGSYAPNAYISALVVRGRVGDVKPTAMVDLGRPSYKLGIAEINVGWKSHELKVRVSPEKERFRVREKARVKIKVTTADGKVPPAGAEIAVAVVDEGLLELKPNDSWKLLDAMMQKRPYGVETSTAQMHVVGKRHFGLKALPSGGGGGNKPTRELFDTLLYWNGRVLLDRNGEAYVEFPINDSITSFRVAVIASASTGLFGTGGASITSTQDLIILSGIAPLVREGDRFKSQFTLRNSTSRSMDVMAKAEVKGAERDFAPTDVKLGPGESKEITFDITAPVNAQSLTYTLDAKEASGARDSIKVVQKVIPAVPVRTTQNTLTQVDKEFDIKVKRPDDSIKGRGGIKLTLRPSIAGNLGGVKEYMGNYPYTCMEQRVSRAIALKDKKLWDETMSLLPAYMDADGLVKYFPVMRNGSDVLTSYILAISNEAGLEIPSESRQRMTAALRGFLNGTINTRGPLLVLDLPMRKLSAIEALSRTGEADVNQLATLPIEPNLWPTSTLLDWINVLKRMGAVPERDKRLVEAMQILRSRLNFQGTIMTLSDNERDNMWWLMTSTDTNSVRLILSVLDDEKWKEDMPRLVQGALKRQRKGSWDLTVANAWGVVAFDKFSSVFEKTPVSGSTVAKLQDTLKTFDWNVDSSPVLIPWTEGAQTLEIEHKGEGRPWAAVQSLAAVPLKESFSSGYRIKKSITPVLQKTPGKWSRGDVVKVHIEVDAQSDMTWVVVNDPIPGGATILGSGLGRDSAMLSKMDKKCHCTTYVERTFEGYKAYYAYMPKGSFTAEYTMRLNQEGTYNLPTTRVEALYSPEMFGEAPNEAFEVH